MLRERRLSECRGIVSTPDKKLRFAVLGAGHGGLAMAGHLAIMGYPVNIYSRSEERMRNIQARGAIEVEGQVEGQGVVANATNNIQEAVKDADIIMVVVPAMGHRFMAEQCAPHLRDGQIIILNPGRTFGAIEFRHLIRDERKVKADVTVAEAQTLLYVSRHEEFAKARIFRIKNSVPLAAIPAHKTPEVLRSIREIFPQFVAATNVLETSLDNIGAIFHPATVVFNAARIEDEHTDFEFYIEGVTPSVAKVLEHLDNERVSLGEALGVHLHTARQWLYLAYDSPGRTLYDAIQATPSYRGVRAPPTLVHRYLMEDVPMSLVPMSSLGDLLGVPTPSIDAIIHHAGLLNDRDYWEEGRTVEKLGLSGMTVEQIRSLVLTGE
jgi:opine dehydrogenase